MNQRRQRRLLANDLNGPAPQLLGTLQLQATSAEAALQAEAKRRGAARKRPLASVHLLAGQSPAKCLLPFRVSADYSYNDEHIGITDELSKDRIGCRFHELASSVHQLGLLHRQEAAFRSISRGRCDPNSFRASRQVSPDTQKRWRARGVAASDDNSRCH